MPDKVALTERDYDVVRSGPLFCIRRPTGGMLRTPSDFMGRSSLVRFRNADDAFTYIREHLIDKPAEPVK